MEIKRISRTFQHVTWIVKDFLELPQENGYFLDSPEFPFCGDIYCLRMYPKLNDSAVGDGTEFHFRRLSFHFPEREVSGQVGLKMKEREGDESYLYDPLTAEYISYPRSWFEKKRDVYIPDGNFILVCSMRLSEEEEGEEEQGGHGASFSSRWSSPKMELTTVSPCTHVELTLLKFFQLPRRSFDYVTSPEFRFAGDVYCLRFRPDGDTDNTDLQLLRLTYNFPDRTVSYRLGYGWSKYYTFSSDYRSLVGTVGFCTSWSNMKEATAKYVFSVDLCLVLYLHQEEQSSAAVGTSDAAQKRTGFLGIPKLQSDYRQLLQKGTDSDASVVVRGKEFRVHRVVLRSRSTVFEAMFGHDTAEKESGRVVVDDLDSDTFGDFLEYLYTGDVHAGLSDDNVFGLYEVADKYDASTLKSECVEHMRRTLSVDSFCDVVTLALLHSEEELLRHAISFFKDNLPRIIITSKWQQFNIDNAASVNEFFIKTFVPVTQRDPRSPDLPVCTINTVSEPVFFPSRNPYSFPFHSHLERRFN